MPGEEVQTSPFYFKSTVVLLGVFLAVAVMYILQDLLIPITYGVFLAILLWPLDKWLEQRKIHRIISITIVLTLSTIVVVAFGYLVATQISRFSEHSSELTGKIEGLASDAQDYLRSKFGLSQKSQTEYINKMTSKGMETGGAVAGSLLNIVEAVILVPIYAFLFLYYRELFEEFFLSLVAGRKKSSEVRDLLKKNSRVLFDYLAGKALETVIVIILGTGGLYLMGVEYALLFGIIAALFNLIPFIGIQVSALLPMFVSMLTKDSFWYAAGIFGMFTLIQFIDNHLIIPFVVGPKISLNAFSVVLVLIAGDMLWGISGMVLSMPIAAMLKIVFDSSPQTEAWGILLGNELSPRILRKSKP